MLTLYGNPTSKHSFNCPIWKISQTLMITLPRLQKRNTTSIETKTLPRFISFLIRLKRPRPQTIVLPLWFNVKMILAFKHTMAIKGKIIKTQFYFPWKKVLDINIFFLTSKIYNLNLRESGTLRCSKQLKVEKNVTVKS